MKLSTLNRSAVQDCRFVMLYLLFLICFRSISSPYCVLFIFLHLIPGEYRWKIVFWLILPFLTYELSCLNKLHHALSNKKNLIKPNKTEHQWKGWLKTNSVTTVTCCLLLNESKLQSCFLQVTPKHLVVYTSKSLTTQWITYPMTSFVFKWGNEEVVYICRHEMFITNTLFMAVKMIQQLFIINQVHRNKSQKLIIIALSKVHYWLCRELLQLQ